MTVGTNAEFPPFEYLNDDGEPDGFDMAVMRAIADEMGYEINIVNMEFKSLTASLKTGGLDAVAAAMTVTEERKQTVDFSDSYYTATQSIVVPVGSSIETMEELNGKRVAVQEGTTGDLLVTPGDDNETVTDDTTQVKRFKKGTDAIMELKNGGVDGRYIIEEGTPEEIFEHPKNERLKSFLGKVSAK